MATFVLVHGGGHGGWCYQLVARRLQAKGHIVYTPSLPGMGEHKHQLHPGIDLDATRSCSRHAHRAGSGTLIPATI
jgi:alpha-beta hydrolase superfamily lysophospholipase